MNVSQNVCVRSPLVCDPLDWRPPRSSVRVIFQAKHFMLQDFPQCPAIFAGHLYLTVKN